IYATRFWTPRFCRAIIRAAEAVGAFEPQPDDPVPGHEVSLAVISPRLFEAVQADIGVRLWPLLQQAWPCIDYHGLRDAFVIRYALGEQESLRIHHDVAQVSASIKLNDDYEGGELEFPRQGVTNAAVPVGSVLAWPSLVTHPHQTNQLRSGVKYALTIWCELPAYLE
ncbi:MAG TPA: 2OG-Fe(II) oxygenase, partial [Ilumatobacteraceae bacterium]|nr:2OG-Fe(II) oxygenase [Ilumatobacteraceae bacterium]